MHAHPLTGGIVPPGRLGLQVPPTWHPVVPAILRLGHSHIEDDELHRLELCLGRIRSVPRQLVGGALALLADRHHRH